MLEFILKYWIQWLFGLIAAGLGFACRKIYKLYINEKTNQKNQEQEEFFDELKNLIQESTKQSQKEDAKLQEQINTMKAGILSLQGRSFKQDCRELLKEDHEITLTEFETLQKEYTTYKSLGGNSNGDDLYEMAKEKAMHDIAQ